MTTDERTPEERRAYLSGLAADFGIDEGIVFEIARMLGPNEDYDGLVTTLEDYQDFEY